MPGIFPSDRIDRSRPIAVAIAVAVAASILVSLLPFRVARSQQGGSADAPLTEALTDAIGGDHRSAADRARDRYRHPKETLEFFGFRPDMTVVEIWPASGWYTEILAPALRARGKLYAAQFAVNPPFAYQRAEFGQFLTMLGSAPEIYDQVVITHLDFPYQLEIAPRESADLVLTFRNVHNWFDKGYGQDAKTLAFRAMYDALKPGGVLGIVDHRWPDPSSEDPEAGNGYVSEERTIEYAEAAGFRFVGRSDVNRNPRDTHDHPEGVWTLPPTLALGDKDKARYLDIGESDRFTLKFVKPAP